MQGLEPRPFFVEECQPPPSPPRDWGKNSCRVRMKCSSHFLSSAPGTEWLGRLTRARHLPPSPPPPPTDQ